MSVVQLSCLWNLVFWIPHLGLLGAEPRVSPLSFSVREVTTEILEKTGSPWEPIDEVLAASPPFFSHCLAQTGRSALT